MFYLFFGFVHLGLEQVQRLLLLLRLEPAAVELVVPDGVTLAVSAAPAQRVAGGRVVAALATVVQQSHAPALLRFTAVAAP